MYDSRSSHARPPQHTATILDHLVALDQLDYDIWMGRIPGPKPVPSKRAMIAAEIDGDERFFTRPVVGEGLKRMRSPWWLTCAHGFESWKADLICRCTEFTAETTREAQRIEALEMANADEEGGIAEIARLREDLVQWEIEAPENVVWSSALVEEVDERWFDVDTARWEDEFRIVEDEDDAEELDDDYEGASTWLTGTLDDLVDAVGHDGYSIEGPVRTPSPKAAGNVRVHELARDCGVPSSAMIRHLRLNGEYVANNLSYVANPVADRMREVYGAVVEVHPIDRLRALLTAV